MRTVNKVILIGNITKDPLVKNTESNRKVAMFTIATNRYFKTAD
jgi:single-strand DNA-binding protein